MSEHLSTHSAYAKNHTVVAKLTVIIFSGIQPSYISTSQIGTSTARALNKEVDQVQEGNVPVMFVCLDPVINNRLKHKT